MKTTCAKLMVLYLAALRAYVTGGPDAVLLGASKLGRKALRMGLSFSDLTLIHEEALMILMPSAGVAAEGERMIRSSGFFFRRALEPLVMVAGLALPVEAGKPVIHAVVADLTALRKTLRDEKEKRKVAEMACHESRQKYNQLRADSRAMQKQLKCLSHDLLRAQEDERRKISRELHDDISQILTGINVRLAALKLETSANTGSVSKKISNAQRLVEKSVAVVHRFARELRPAMLDDLGLVPALTTFMKEFRKRSGLPVRFVASKGIELETLDCSRRTVLYRIAQEALTNVIKHAQASRVSVSLQCESNEICLEVVDDGKSFSVPRELANKSRKHLGLIGMRERAEMVGGKLAIESASGQGTKVRVCIPVRNGVK